MAAKLSPKALRRGARAEQGFELSPPRCISCQHYDAPAHGRPESLVHRREMLIYRPPQCSLGKFDVKPHSICDRWVGAEGEVLDV